MKLIRSIFATTQVLLVLPFSNGFQASSLSPSCIATTSYPKPSQQQKRLELIKLHMAEGDVKKGAYDPKWKKTLTLAEQQALENGGKVLVEKDKGLKGNIAVVFKSGNVTKTTMALPGQPLSDAAVQAGAFIRYGCKKGECGTCEALCNGQYIRPCISKVPADLRSGQEYLVELKAIKAKRVSSGKFYTAKSIVLGFWNNLLGMVGFVKTRRAAKKNWEERQEYEDMIKMRTKELKAARLAREAEEAKLRAAGLITDEPEELPELTPEELLQEVAAIVFGKEKAAEIMEEKKEQDEKNLVKM